MRQTLSALCVTVIGVSFVLALCVMPVRAETVGCGPEEVKATSNRINQVRMDISAAASAGRVDDALNMLKQFDLYPLSPDAAESRHSIAVALKRAGRSAEAVPLLQKTVTDDPYNRITPDSLALLSDILYYDLKDTAKSDEYLAFLAANYFPEIQAVIRARSAFAPNMPDAPRAKKVLLDESLGESSIFSRFYLGSTNFCQWDVIRSLGGAGYAVHDNGWKPGLALTADMMNQYGLVIMNGGPTDGKVIPDSAVEHIVSYVKLGGRLLVVCAGTTLGSHKMTEFYGPLMTKFGMNFEDGHTTGGSTVTCKPTSHPALAGIKDFRCTFGVRVSGGEPIGLYGSDAIMSIKTFGRGIVIAAGIGTGFQGNTIGDLYRVTDAQKAEAKMNRTLLVALAKYLTSSVK